MHANTNDRSIALDNVIYSLQKHGGISSWWSNHCNGILNSFPNDISFIDNYDRIADIKIGQFPLWSVLPVTVSKQCRLFHSSYFRRPSRGPVHILTFHDATMARCHGFRSRIHKQMHKLCINRSDVIHCVSHHTMNELLKYYKVRSSTVIKVIHHGFSPNSSHPIPATLKNSHPIDFPYVLFVGNRSGYKNGTSAELSIMRDPEINIVFAGGPPPSDYEVFLSRKYNIQDRVHWIGHVSRPQLNWLYQNAIALVYPSSNEGFGFPAVEAASHGCPVVAIRGHAVQEVCGDYPRYICAPDPDAIYQGIVECSNLSKNKLYESGRRVCNKLSWERYSDEMSSLYRSIL